MALKQGYKEYRVLDLPSSGLQAGDRYYLNVGGGKYKTYIVSDGLQLTEEAGNEFIECDTVDDLRNLDARQIWAIQNGYYKGVRLSGYYSKGDTPSEIAYHLSETEEAPDGGSVFEVGGIKLEHKFSGLINWLYFGANPSQTNNIVFLKNCCLYAMNNNLPVELDNSTTGEKFNISSNSDTILINKSLIVKGVNGTVLNVTSTGTSTTLFTIQGSIDENSTLKFLNITCEGVNRTRFIGKESNVTTFPKIKRMDIVGLRLGTQSLTITWLADTMYINDVIGGIGVTDTTNSAFFFSISPDTSVGKVCSSLTIKNIYGYGGTEDLDMFFFKGRNYRTINITNCTAEWKALIPERTGDGFDLDGIGERALLENIRTINCGCEIKYNSYLLNDNYNLIGNNVRSTYGSISLRCGGHFTNITSENPVTAGLIISGYTQGGDLNQAYLNIVNASVLYDDTFLAKATAPVTLAYPNVNIKNLRIMPHIDTPEAQSAHGLRVSSCKNVIIDGLHVQNSGQIWATPSDQVLENITIKDVTGVNNRDRGFDFGENTTVSDFTVDNLKVDGYLASYNNLFQIRSTQILSNIRINNFPYTWYGVLWNLSTFKPMCQNFTIDGEGWDTTDALGLPPISTTWPVGIIVKKRSENALFMRISGAITPSVAYKKIENLNATPTVKGLVNQSAKVDDVASANATTDTASTATDVTEMVTDFNDLVGKYNSMVTLVNELKTQLNAKLGADRTSGQQSIT